MKILEHTVRCNSRTDHVTLYPIGDVHIGALNCAESKLRRLVKTIQHDDTAWWIGGGDYLDAVILQDEKRFDPKNLPAWMLDGKAEDVRVRLADILDAQKKRFVEIMTPIKSKCIGLIEGNHEHVLMKRHNRDLMKQLAEELETVELTDCAFIRLRCERHSGPHCSVECLRVFVAHGHGGGRTSGAEPIQLARLVEDKDCDVALRGHSHSFFIPPAKTRLTIPTKGELGEDPLYYAVRTGNWGTFLLTYKSGPSTYDSRAMYPARPMSTLKVVIHPFKDPMPQIELIEIPL